MHQIIFLHIQKGNGSIVFKLGTLCLPTQCIFMCTYVAVGLGLGQFGDFGVNNIAHIKLKCGVRILIWGMDHFHGVSLMLSL